MPPTASPSAVTNPANSMLAPHCAHPPSDAVDLDMGYLDPEACRTNAGTCCTDIVRPEGMGTCTASVSQDNIDSGGWADCGCGDACSCRKGSKLG